MYDLSPVKLNYKQIVKFCDDIINGEYYNDLSCKLLDDLRTVIVKNLPDNIDQQDIAGKIVNNISIEVNAVLIDSELDLMVEKLGKAMAVLYARLVVKNGLSLETFLQETVRSYRINVVQ